MLAVIGGSGFGRLDEPETASLDPNPRDPGRREGDRRDPGPREGGRRDPGPREGGRRDPGAAVTPFGDPSGQPAVVRIEGSPEPVIFLPRHGSPHAIAPHQINYRANIWALKQAGADRIIAINSVGSLRREWPAGTLILPDQLIDYTWGREHTFARPEDPVEHLDFSHPYTPSLRTVTIDAAKRAQVEIVDGAVYGCTQGPRFETPAEIARMSGDGCDLVGMTGMPEAILAREADLPYLSICVVGNLAAGLAGSDQVLEHIEIAATTAASNDRVRQIIRVLSATRT